MTLGFSLLAVEGDGLAGRERRSMKRLHITLRRDGALIRVVSARDMSAREGWLMKKARKIPAAFASEAEERDYWEREDSTADLDWRRAERVRLPNLQPSTTAISLRLPVSLLERIKIAAHKRDVPYQSLIKMWLAEKVVRAPPPLVVR